VVEVEFRRAAAGDLERMQGVRRAAFAPVFASFRSILGDELYELAQKRDDDAQEQLLASLCEDAKWELYVAETGGELVGFMALRLDRDTRIGELGLNAVHPAHAGQGIGTAMYEFGLARLKAEGMLVATVGTGGDPSHAPARRAYQKVGFASEIPSLWMLRKL